MNQETRCPQCGAEIRFQSSLSLWMVCPYCSSTIIKNDFKIESIGKMSDLRPDISPLQIGSHGTLGGREFTVVGRIRNLWSDGEWNEWFIVYSDFSRGNPSTGWIAEAQGEWMISHEVILTSAAQEDLSRRLADMSVGKEIGLQAQSFELTDQRGIICEGSEGELPFACPRGRRSTVYDFRSTQGLFASIDLASGEAPLLHIGRLEDFENFNFENLRSLHDW